MWVHYGLLWNCKIKCHFWKDVEMTVLSVTVLSVL